jgi:TetR/AcrR family transcriptional repressor of nem operon
MPQVSVKQRLVEHAEDVFRRLGYDGASVQDITTAARVPKGSFYNHFESKQALAAEIVGRYCQDTDLAVLAQPGVAPLDRLRRHFSDQLNRIASSGVEFGCLLGTFANAVPAAGEQVQSMVLRGLEEWSEAVAATVQDGQDDGDIASDRSARDVAILLIDTYEGGILRARVTGDFTNVRSNMDILLASLTT